MSTDPTEILFYCAGMAFASHFAFSMLLKMQLQGDDDLIRSLFLMPNAWLGNTWGPQLLQSKYFLPWAERPNELDDYSFSVRATFLIARITGGAVPILFLTCFGVGLYMGGR